MDFYDDLSPFYHLIYDDWTASIARQGGELSALIEREWPGARKLLDVACGIGTQSLGLASRGYRVSASDLSQALGQMQACLAPGGGCIVTVRDYEIEERGRNLVKPYGVRCADERRYLVFQVWDFEGERYDLSFFFVEEDLATGETSTTVLRSRYYAVSVRRLLRLMEEAGFSKVRRVDGAFFQPVLVGTKRG